MTTIADAPGRDAPAGLVDAVMSEWTKIRTVRSTYWTLGIMAGGAIVFGAVASAVDASSVRSGPGAAGSLSPVTVSLATFEFFAPLMMMLLGALVITPEHSTGMIRVTLAVQPRRGTVFTAKALVLAAVAFTSGLVTSLAAFLTGQGILHGSGHAASLSDPGAWRSVIGITMYATLIGLFSYGAGVIIRSTAGTIVTMAGIMFILPLITEALSLGGISGLTRWLPTSAGGQMLSAGAAGTGMFGPWGQLAITATWTVIVLGVASGVLDSRDA